MKLQNSLALLEKCLSDDVEVPGGSQSLLEYLEELRLVLGSMMRKETLQALWDLNKELNIEPKHSEIYTYFIKNSLDGIECKYALKALDNFKKNRIARMRLLLKTCLEELDRVENVE